MIRVLIADDHAIVRSGLMQIIATTLDITTVGEATHGEEIPGQIAAVAADLLLLDMAMPGLSGIELQRELNRRGEHAPMIFVTSYEDDRTRNAALSGGALAFLRKPVNIGKLMGCLESVLGPQP